MVYLQSQICGGSSKIYGEIRVEFARDYNLFKKRARGRAPEHSRRKF